MKIVVLIKNVPDTWGERRLDPQTGRVDRGASEAVIDEVGERAIEAALVYKDGADAEVVVMTMGPEAAKESLRKGLAMGADSAVHIKDDGLVGADMVRTSGVLAAAIKQVGFDLVIAGDVSTDGGGGVVPAMVAEALGVPHLTHLDSVSITAQGVSGEREATGGVAEVRADLPAVISVTERTPEGRFPNFRGIMRARKKPTLALSLGDIAGLPEQAVTRTSVLSAAQRPAREAGVKVVDEGDGGQKLFEYLSQENLV
ncbi:electron transfer flavoprotein subunit beta/FixA family protein [Pseudactinotalea sp. Z1748]|uniref:electron transfer flavoprotein subunit beta/FixA family protein n=1 Tax=Pseudactinotalea sp. Z1748 TaxID=3413027 RepID=UPI003C7CFEA2